MSVLPLPRPAVPAPAPPVLRGDFGPSSDGILPDRRALLDWRGPYLVPLAILVLTRVVMGWLLPLASEDAYITFRYARSWVLGLGPYFNPGERVMGFTSPLWMAWNALGYLATRNPVTWSRVTALAADAFTLMIAARLLERHASRAAAWCFAFTFAAWTAFTAVAISGMENGVMITLVLLSAALAERRSAATGPALAALALIRPEGVVAAILVAIIARHRDRWVALAIAATVWLALGLTYGSPLPQSVLAKAQIYGTPGPWAGRHWWEWAFPAALGRWPAMPDGRFLYLITVLAAPAAVVGARILWRARASALAVATAALLVVWLGYALSGATYFFWYLVTPIAGWFLLASVGLPHIVRGRAIYVSAALLVLGCWSVVWELYAARARAESDFEQVAQVLVAGSRPWEKALLEPIGIVGWRAKLRLLDETGLISPAIARRRLGAPGWMSDVIAAERPEWWVARRGELQHLASFAGRGAPFRSAAERDALLAQYAIERVVDDAAGDAALVVLRRRG